MITFHKDMANRKLNYSTDRHKLTENMKSAEYGKKKNMIWSLLELFLQSIELIEIHFT